MLTMFYSPIKPYRIDTRAAKEIVEKESKSRVLDLMQAETYTLDL